MFVMNSRREASFQRFSAGIDLAPKPANAPMKGGIIAASLVHVTDIHSGEN